jgi:hypothetical protein
MHACVLKRKGKRSKQEKHAKSSIQDKTEKGGRSGKAAKKPGEGGKEGSKLDIKEVQNAIASAEEPKKTKEDKKRKKEEEKAKKEEKKTKKEKRMKREKDGHKSKKKACKDGKDGKQKDKKRKHADGEEPEGKKTMQRKSADGGSSGGKNVVATKKKGKKGGAEPRKAAHKQHMEEQRWRKIKWLKNRLYRLCKQVKAVVPLLAFTRWLSRCKLHQQEQQGSGLSGGAQDDPLIPNTSNVASSIYVDEGLPKDLIRRNPKLGLDDARNISLKMSEAAMEALSAMTDGEGRRNGKIIVARQKEALTLQLDFDVVGGGDSDPDPAASDDKSDKARMPIAVNKSHYRKLQQLCSAAKNSRNGGSDDSDDGGDEGADFDSCVWCLLTRYDTLRPHGYQAALNQHGFQVLERRLGVSCECFASPLNCHFGAGGYCSAFPDTDKVFGSRGSFFESYPTSGSFEANPPFVPEVMLAMVKHMELLLTLSVAKETDNKSGQTDDNAMSFVVIIPAWESKPKANHWSSWDKGSSQPTYPAHKFLEASKWKRRSFLVDAGAHGFRNGAQHQCEDCDQYKPSFYDTAIIILQNAAGARKWRVDGEYGSALEQELKEAMSKAKGAEWSGRRVRDGLRVTSS